MGTSGVVDETNKEMVALLERLGFSSGPSTGSTKEEDEKKLIEVVEQYARGPVAENSVC